MRDYAYYNGVLTPYDATCIPLYDRSIFFADSVYDVMIGRGKIPYQADEHLKRLLSNAAMLGLKNLPTKEELLEAIDATLEKAEADAFTLYVQLSGKQKRRMHSRAECGTNILVTATSSEIPSELSYVRAVTHPDLRHAYCNVKTTSLFAAVLSVEIAKAQDAEIAILHRNGLVTEASYANVSLILADRLITHPRDARVLPGISERNLVSVANSIGLKCEVREFTLDEMLTADLVLLTSTTKLLKVCSHIDGSPLYTRNVPLARQLFAKMRSDLLKKTAAES